MLGRTPGAHRNAGIRGDEHLVFLGDYIDRGPDARGVIETCMALSKEVKCTFLRGNHEAMMLDALRSRRYDDVNLWMGNGGGQTVLSYGSAQIAIPDDHLEWVRATKLYYETDEFFFVHAGLNPALSVARNVALDMETVFLWERRHLEHGHLEHGHLDWDALPWDKTVVCGHTIQERPISHKKLICIDTGAFLSYWPGRRQGYLTI